MSPPSRRSLLRSLAVGATALGGCAATERFSTRSTGRTTTRTTLTTTGTRETTTGTTTTATTESPRTDRCDRRWHPGERWSFRTGSNAFRPVVADGVVCFGSDDNHLYGVDAATGEMAWRVAHDSPGVAAPVAGDGVVTYQGYDRVATYDVADGRPRWSFAPPGAHPRFAWSLGSAGDAVYVGLSNHASPSVDVDDPYDRVYAFDRQSGERLWRASIEPESERNRILIPTAVAAGGGVVAVPTERGVLVGLDASDGSERWREAVGDSPETPVVADRTVLQVTTWGLLALDAASGRISWRAQGERTPAVADGVAYCPGNGVLRAFELADGERHWAVEIPRDGNGDAPTAADGAVYLPTSVRTVYAFDTASGCRRGGLGLRGIPTTSAVAGDTLYVGGKGSRGRLLAVPTA